VGGLSGVWGLVKSPVRSCTRTDHPFRRRLSRSAGADVLLTMGQLN
jgi:hypothetical protein